MAKVNPGMISLIDEDSHPVENAKIGAAIHEPNDNRKIIINISGQSFVTTFNTLLKYPATKLGNLAKQQPPVTSYFFESDADIFKEILKFYRNDELHCPKSVCYSDFLRHLEFWEIEELQVSDCCVQDVNEQSELTKQFEYFDRRITFQADTDTKIRSSKSYLVWCFMTDPYGPDTRYRLGSKMWALGYLLFTIFSGTSAAVFTVPSLWNLSEWNSTENYTVADDLDQKMTCDHFNERWVKAAPPSAADISLACCIVYAVEIWIRFFVCPDKRKFWRSFHGPDMIISIIEVLGSILIYTAILFFIPNADRFTRSSSWCRNAFAAQVVLLFISQLRYFRLLSYASVYCGLKILLITLHRSWKEILLLVALLTMSVLIFGPLVYFSVISTLGEGLPLNSIPAAYWFVIVTMTTVGYGDMYPTTFAGYLFTIVVMIVGLTITALPIAIVGGNFSVVYEFNQKRDREILRQEARKKSLAGSEKSIPSVKRAAW